MTIIANDRFPSANGTALVGSVSTSGHTWIAAPGSSDMMTIDTAFGCPKGAYASAGSSLTAEAVLDAVAPSAAYTVIADLVIGNGADALSDYVGIMLRSQAGADSKYRGYTNNSFGRVQLLVDKVVGSAQTPFGSDFIPVLTNMGDVIRLIAQIATGRLMFMLQNVTQGSALQAWIIINDPDVSLAGKAGLLYQHTSFNHQPIVAFDWLSAGAATKLGFIQQPREVITKQVHPVSVLVAIQDVDGLTVPGDTRTVTLTRTPVSGETYDGAGITLSKAAVDGIATFDNLFVKGSQLANYTWAATTTGGLTAATSDPIIVNTRSAGVLVRVVA